MPVTGLKVHDGAVAGWVTDSTRSDNSVDFLADLVVQTPVRLDLHIADNLSAHKTDRVPGFLAANPHVHIYHWPTDAGWLNRVERRLLRRGEFDSVDDLAQDQQEQLAERVIEFIKNYNKRTEPFRWTGDGRPLVPSQSQ